MTDKPLTDYQISDAPVTSNPFDVPPTKNKTTPNKSNPNRKAASPLPTWREGAIAKWCTDMYMMAGTFTQIYDPVCGGALIEIAEPAGKAWEKLAKQDNNWRRFFAWMMQGSSYAEIIGAHAVLGIAIMTHHGPFRKTTEELASRFGDMVMNEMNGDVA